MIVAVDIGNTRVKAAVFEGDILIETFAFLKATLINSIENVLEKYKSVTHLVVVSVSDVEIDAFNFFLNRISLHFVSQTDSFPFINCYEMPLTLGVDRMVLATGATLRYPDQNRLVIDAGTCITYDFIDCKNNYFGGAISPGFRLRYESLHNYTANLPNLTLNTPRSFIGASTVDAIHSGVVNGMVYEIDGFIDDYMKKYSKFTIILTGGDSVFLAKRLKNAIFADSNFLLESLNQTYQYQIQND